MQKRGISSVITTALLILIVLAAVGILWVVVSIFIGAGTGGIGGAASCFNVNLVIDKVVYDEDTSELGVRINRKAGNLDSIKIIVGGSDVSDILLPVSSFPQIGETKTFLGVLSEDPRGKDVEIAAIIKGKTCGIADKEVVAGGSINEVSEPNPGTGGGSFSVSGFFYEDFLLSIPANENLSFLSNIDWDGNSVMSPTYIKYKDAVDTTNIIGIWDLDEYNGDTVIHDVSGNGNDGRLVTPASHISAKLGNGFDININEGKISFDTSPNLFNIGTSTDLTISLWVNSTQSNAILNNRKFGSNGISCFQEFGFNSFRCQLKGTGGSVDFQAGAGIINTNEWAHVVLVLDRSGDAVIYINNIERARTGISGLGDLNAAYPMEFAGASEFSTQNFDGQIDEIIAWNRVLSPSEINELYGLGGVKYSSSIESNTIDTGENIYGLKGEWVDNGNVSVKVFVDGQWCNMVNGKGISDSSCTLAWPISNFRYNISLNGSADLDYINFSWINDTFAQCSDFYDNDGDGFIDLDDFSCSDSNDNDETNPKPACNDGLDNDNDGVVDYPADGGCYSLNDNTENFDELTIVSVENDILVSNVKKLGLNIDNRAWYGASAHIMKNIFPNPGFEQGEKATIVMSTPGSTANDFEQWFWSADYNGGGIGLPEDFWNGAEFEFLNGPAKGYTGQITDFYFGPGFDGGNYNHFLLDTNVPVPDAIDAMAVRKTGISGIGGAYSSTSTSQSNDIPPGSSGEKSANINGGGNIQYVYDSEYSHTSGEVGGKNLIVEGDWNLSFWAKGQNNGDIVRFSFYRAGQPNFVSQDFALTTAWQRYEYDFNVASGADDDKVYNPNEEHPLLWIAVSAPIGGDSVYVDDVYLGKRDDVNPTDFSDNYVNALKEYNPGVIRWWGGQLGSSFDNLISDQYGRKTVSYRFDYQNQQDMSFGLHEFLELSAEIGAEPWFVVPPTMTDQDFSNLVDYLAGSTSTSYGLKRSQLGQLIPWTSIFDSIYVEYANEAWGGGVPGSDPFAGATFGNGANLAEAADSKLAIMRSNPNFNSKINLIIGGQAGYPGRQTEIDSISNSHDVIAIAPYFSNIPNSYDNESVYSTVYTEVYRESIVGNSSLSNENLINSGKGTEMAIYEINYHATGGGLPLEEIRNNVMTGQAGGIALPLNMLGLMKNLGVRTQTAFTALQWGFRVGAISMVSAEKLDLNKVFLSTETANVISNNSVYSTLSSGQYLRVNFDYPINKYKFISICVPVSGASFEVYSGNDLVYSFVSDSSCKFIALENLPGWGDSFDFKLVSGGSVNIDSISVYTGRYAHIWGLFRDIDRINAKRPTGLSNELANKAIFGDMITTSQSGLNPSWNEESYSGINVPYIQTFAFDEGNSKSLILFNLNIFESIPIQLDLPSTPSNNAVIYQIYSDDLVDNNEFSENVVIDQQNINDFSQGYQFSLPPHSITSIVWSD